MEKQCNKCKQVKPIKEYYKKSGRENGYMSQCKPCFNRSTSERQKKNKQAYVDYLGGACQLCGYNRCIQALDFHHIDSTTKELNLSSGKGYNFKRAKQELDKCMLVCSNCHREIHAGIVSPEGFEPS